MNSTTYVGVSGKISPFFTREQVHSLEKEVVREHEHTRDTLRDLTCAPDSEEQYTTVPCLPLAFICSEDMQDSPDTVFVDFTPTLRQLEVSSEVSLEDQAHTEKSIPIPELDNMVLAYLADEEYELVEE